VKFLEENSSGEKQTLSPGDPDSMRGQILAEMRGASPLLKRPSKFSPSKQQY